MGSLCKCRCPDRSKGRHCSRVIYTDLSVARTLSRLTALSVALVSGFSPSDLQSAVPQVVPYVVIEERAARVHVLGLPAHGYWPGAGVVIKEDFMETFV
jgi:hypothetical protein